MSKTFSFYFGCFLIAVGVAFFNYINSITGSQCPVSEHISACILFGTVAAVFCVGLVAVGMSELFGILSKTLGKLAGWFTFIVLSYFWVAYAIRF